MEQFKGNYTGPNWSDGKKQESVEFGITDPLSELDKLSRLHDTAYAHYKDRAHRDAADEIYERDAKVLAGIFPGIAGNLVLHGNYADRQRAQLGQDLAYYGPAGLFKFAGTNLYNANKQIHGTYLKQEKADIERLYGTDPRKGQAAVTLEGKSKSSLSDAVAREFEEKRKYEKERHLPRTIAVKPSAPTAPVIDVKPKKTVYAKAQNFLAGIFKKNTVVPETQADKVARLIQAQRKNLEHYDQVAANARMPLHKHRKQKKKKLNLRRATEILPPHYIHN